MSSLKGRLIQEYQESLKDVMPRKYRYRVDEALLENLNKAVIVLAAEREFATIAETLGMQLDWLNTTAKLAEVLLDFHHLSTRKAAERATKMMSEDFGKSFRQLVALLDKIAHVTTIRRELKEMRVRLIDEVYNDAFENEFCCSSVGSVRGELFCRLNVEMAKIPGTLASRLIEEWQKLNEFLPELNNAELEQKIMQYRLDFVMERSPMAMDDFRLNIIRVVEEVLKDGSASELSGGLQKKIADMLMTVKTESFVPKIDTESEVETETEG